MNTQPFNAVTKQHDLTEVEANQLKSKLLELRKQYIQQLHLPLRDIEILRALEKEIESLESKLAHANIVEATGAFAANVDAASEPDKKQQGFLLRIRRHAEGKRSTTNPA